METLLDWMTWRNVLVAGVLIVGTTLGVRHHAAIASRYEGWAHPPVGASAGDASISSDLDKQDSLRFQGLYRRVCADLATARADGFNVDALQRAADALVAFDRPEYRAAATERLNKLRLAIPHKAEIVRPAAIDDGVDDELTKAPPVPVQVKAARRRTR